MQHCGVRTGTRQSWPPFLIGRAMLLLILLSTVAAPPTPLDAFSAQFRLHEGGDGL